MDFREGIKRVYLLFSLCILAIPVAVYWDEFPSKSRIDQETFWKIESDIALQLGIKRWDMPKVESPHADFIERYCAGKLSFSKPETPDKKISANAVICESHKEKREFFWIEQAKWVGMVAVVTVLTGLGLLVVFLTMRWVFNGFFPKK